MSTSSRMYGEVLVGAPVGDLYPAPEAVGVEEDEQIDGAVASIFAVVALKLARLGASPPKRARRAERPCWMTDYSATSGQVRLRTAQLAGVAFGQFAVHSGPVMAALDTFEVVVEGRGSGAMPHQGGCDHNRHPIMSGVAAHHQPRSGSYRCRCDQGAPNPCGRFL
jgi:hypothetical protein